MITLYFSQGWMPCCVVRMVAKAVGVQLYLIRIDIRKEENKTPEYRAINPQCTIPCLVDGELILTESRAMMIYLVEKYGKDDSLYPKDVQTRALIHDRLFFDVTNVYRRIADHYYPLMAEDLPQISEKVPLIEEAIFALNEFLSQHQMAASNTKYTIADISLLSTVAFLEVVNFDLSRYVSISAWYARTKTWARRNELLLILDADMERFRRMFSTRV